MKITKKIPERLIKNQNEEDDDQSSQMSTDKEKNDSIASKQTQIKSKQEEKSVEITK